MNLQEMIALQPFTESDFDTLKGWVKDADALFQFAGPIFQYPLTDEQLQAYIQMLDKKPLKVVLLATGQTIGHCELNFENGQRRLSRILVGDQSMRGKRIGEQMVRQMAEMLFQDSNVQEIDLNTFDWNIGAIKCYEKVGFRIDHSQTAPMSIKGTVWTKVNMRLSRIDFHKQNKV